MSIVVGIDPGLAHFGYSVVDMRPEGFFPVSMHLIMTKKSDKKMKVLASDDNTRRGRELVNSFRHVVDHNPVAFCVEAKSFPRNSSAAAKTAISWGVVITIAELYDIPIFQATPQQIKTKMCGKKNASKDEIQNAVDEYFGSEIIHPLVEGLAKTKLEHPYDSIAAVVACSDAEALRLVRKMS